MLKVLVIDSLCGRNASIARRLIAWGHDVARASSCAQALAHQTGSCWHLIFVSLDQLAAEGIEWIPRLRRLWPPALLIVLGDVHGPDLERQVRSQGIDFYLMPGGDAPHLGILVRHFEKRFMNQPGGRHPETRGTRAKPRSGKEI